VQAPHLRDFETVQFLVFRAVCEYDHYGVQAPHLREVATRIKGIARRSSAVKDVAESLRSWVRPWRSGGVLAAFAIAVLWAPVILWPFVASLCWGVVGFLAASRRQRETHELLQRGLIG